MAAMEASEFDIATKRFAHRAKDVEDIRLLESIRRAFGE